MSLTFNAARTILSSLKISGISGAQASNDTVTVKGAESVQGWSSFRVSGS